MKSMTEEMVIISEPFDGSILGYIKKDHTVSHTNGLTFKEYKKTLNKRTKLISWFEFEVLRINYYCTPLVSCEKKEFDMVNKLDRIKETLIRNRFEVFYGKQLSEFINVIYVYDRTNRLYYTGVKKITLTWMELYQEIVRDISVLKIY